MSDLVLEFMVNTPTRLSSLSTGSRESPDKPADGEHDAPGLLAVDVGLATGYARLDGQGRLCWLRSRRYGNVAQLKRGTRHVLQEAHPLTWLALEGGGDLARPWLREAARAGLVTVQHPAEAWRSALLPLRLRNAPSETAKAYAVQAAVRAAKASGAPLRRIPRHDAAEALCLAYFVALEVGLLAAPPEGVFI